MNDFSTTTRRRNGKETIQTVNTAPPVIKTVTIVKKKRSFSIKNIVTSIILLLIALSCCLFIALVIATLGWMQTWRAFTQETVVAEIKVSPVRYDGSHKSSFDITYTPKNDVSALSFLFGNVKSNDQMVTETLPGDQFQIESDFFKWGDWITFIGVKPMYKTSGIAGTYQNLNNYSDPNYPKKAAELNGGEDKTWKYFLDNSKQFNFVGTSYISSAGNNVTNKERTFDLVATEDGMVLKEQ